jgi:large subunit ribosomal protein L29
MKIKELRELTVEELSARRNELKQETVILRIQAQVGQLENPSRLRIIRREVARVETLLSARRMALA